MKEYRLTDWLPTTKKEIELRGWDSVDVILFSADAYVDHPSFGAAVIGRTLEAAGYRVAIVPQPDWRGGFRDFKRLGRPNVFCGIAPGCMDAIADRSIPPLSILKSLSSSSLMFRLYSVALRLL